MRLDLPGIWYVDSTPDRAWAGLYPSDHIRTSRGMWPRPPGGDLLYLRCRVYHGDLYIAGQGHGDGLAWLWADGWHDCGETYGTSPCAFGPLGLYISRPLGTANLDVVDVSTRNVIATITQPLGSRGIAHIDDDGTPHSVDGWYGQDGFAEYTDLGDVRIGQGAQGGIVVRVGAGPLRLLEPGSVQFIRASRDGDLVSVAAWKDVERGAVIYWLTRAELAALPLVSAPPPPPPPDPVEPKPMAFPNILSTLEAVRAQYPELITTEQAVEILNTTAWRHPGFGLLEKPNGNHGPQPKTGIFCSADWLVHLPSGRGTDCFINGPSIDAGNSGEAIPQWHDEGESFVLSRFVAPVEPTGVVTPPKPGEPAPVSTLIDTRALQAVIASLQGSVAGLMASAVGITGRLAALEARPQTGAAPLGRVALKTDDGHYLCAEDGGGGVVNATRTSAGGWETFTVEEK